jgi:hypothetical protein
VAALVALAIAVGVAGCGEDEGVAEGAHVTTYVEPPLCAGATRTNARLSGGEEAVLVDVTCLPTARQRDGLSLAIVGANARRASEDSTTVAYIGGPGTTARFTRPILEAAGIAYLPSSSGDRAMQRVLDAVSTAGSGSLRDEVRETLESSPR